MAKEKASTSKAEPEEEAEVEKPAEAEKVDKEALEKAVQAARDEIKAALTKKKQIDRNLATLESTMYAFETSYLNPTTVEGAQPSFGNIVKGYDQQDEAESRDVRQRCARRGSAVQSIIRDSLDLKDRDSAAAAASEDDEGSDGENRKKKAKTG